jgi:hypothetical protein
MKKETFNIELARLAQRNHCERSGDPHFAPRDGNCYRCKKNIYSEMDRGNGSKSGISVERADGLITGCPHCNATYCD